MQYIAFDSHKRYTLASWEPVEGGEPREERIEHERGAIHRFLSHCESGSPVAVETIGNWYWIVEEIEAAGMVPQLVHARKAKLMMGMINKTDKLDARGMNRLQRNGTLPTVWIPPGELRDQRDLPRTRMVLTRQRTQLKNRIHATLAKYALKVEDCSDIFGRQGMVQLKQKVELLPPHTRFSTEQMLEEFESLDGRIHRFEERIEQVIEPTPEIQRLQSIPGIGPILATVIGLEVGTVDRFATAEKLAAYAGTTPRVHSSGDKTRFGKLRSDVNRYLKWAFVEAANSISLNRRHAPNRHVTQLYGRIRQRKGHAKAIGAVARHLAEAVYWILRKKETYRDPAYKDKTVSSTEG